MARSRRTDPLLERALLEADLKLGGQGSALRELLGQARGEYIRTRRVNASNARAIQASAMLAAPATGKAFDQALGTVAAQRQALGYGGPGDVQAQAYARRVGEQKANALVDLVGQAQRAEAGRVYGGDVARNEYLGTKRKIVGQLGDLAREQGATAQLAYGRLKGEQAGRGVTKRGQDITARGQDIAEANRRATLAETARHNQAMEAARQAGRRAPKLASLEQHSQAKTQIDQAVALVQQQKARGQSRPEIIQLLTKGREGSTVDVDGEKVRIPSIRPLPADFVRAAANLAYDGSLSRGDLQRLHDRRLRVKALGYRVRPPARPAATLGELARGPTSMSMRPPVPLGR